MTDIVTPIPIDALPPTPTPADTPQDFDSKAFALLAALVAMVAQFNDTGGKTSQNAIAANERAVSAAASASAAGGSANAAAQDAARLAALDALWLGAFASDPGSGRGGIPLQAGNSYVNTVTGTLRAYNGSAWVQGMAYAFDVLAALNTKQDTLVSGSNLKTVNGLTLVGSGNASVTIQPTNAMTVAYTAGKVTGVTEDGVTTTLTYDGAGRVSTIAWPRNGKTRTETYTYNGAGQLTGMTAVEA